jgi:hypothetical protein
MRRAIRETLAGDPEVFTQPGTTLVASEVLSARKRVIVNARLKQKTGEWWDGYCYAILCEEWTR